MRTDLTDITVQDIAEHRPSAGYRTILADPPWKFRTWNEDNQAKSPSRHYGLMDLDAIKALPVAAAAAQNAVLLMWACNPMIPQALEVIAAWGFSFKTVAFTWAKQSSTGAKWHFGLGYWTRQNTEQCFLAVRGDPKPLARNVPQLIVAPRREHSRKPDAVHERVERVSPGPYLELFGRTRRPGWDVWGNEADKFQHLEGQ